MEVQVGKVQDEGVQGIRVTLAAAACGKELTEARFRPLTDMGVWRTIINKKDWQKVGDGAKFRPTMLKFRPYGTRQFLPILGQAKLTLQAEVGATIDREVYVNNSKTEESLLGEDAEQLGIIQVQVQGGSEAVEVRRVRQNKKPELEATRATEETPDIEDKMNRVTKEFKRLFQGIGRYKGPPVQIQVKPGARPVIQPPRRIPLHYREPLEDHLAKLLEQDVIEGPLQEEERGTWISNLVITAKAWDKEKERRPGERVQIRANLDCRPLNEVVYQTHEPIPMVEELRHTLKGSTRFSKLDLAHCFHQFEIEESA